ncbi:MAG TPA: acetyl-CoA carboxylase biotin carboxyl carrier protein [bacterium]|nr:acetyl-CoA carboxylase biotin carboxyl carrier protein [bacterium]HNT64567.1 acetyl-CoA carboxylase biotin carboxyl carrier protein [bacterium]
MGVDKIREYIKIVEASGIDELEITTWWGKRIRIRKTAKAQAVSPVAASDSLPLSQVTALKSIQPDDSSASEKSPAAAGDNRKMLEFKAPIVGTFYRAPSPDAEPYIKEGDQVSPGKVLCIIEAMKLMNEIEAEVDGRIAKILVENGQPVEYNQPLFLIEV